MAFGVLTKYAVLTVRKINVLGKENVNVDTICYANGSTMCP